MELPIAQDSYQPSPAALVRAVRRARIILARTAAEESTLDDVSLFVNADRAKVAEVNFAADIALAPDAPATQAEDLLQRIDDHFAQAGGRCMTLCASEAKPAPALIDLAATRGYKPHESVVYLLKGYTSMVRAGAGAGEGEGEGEGEGVDLQIIPARAAYPLLGPLFEQSAPAPAPGSGPGRGEGASEASDARDAAKTRIDFLDEARLDVSLGRHDNETVGFASLLSLGQMGLIEFVYTVPQLRCRGVASRLMDHAIEHCERSQFEQVLLALPVDHPETSLFERMGFAAVARYTDLVRS